MELFLASPLDDIVRRITRETESLAYVPAGTNNGVERTLISFLNSVYFVVYP